MNTTRIYQNCSPTCAEMLGGDCPGENCIYRPNLRLVTSEEPWLAFASREQIEAAAELRGLRIGHRYARTQYRQGVKVGFWVGVGTVFACMFLLAILQWIAR